jgi:HEPN domain-containing protein
MAADAAASWLKIVDEDLRQVVNNLRGPLPSPAGAAYHCQQAAEKLVKAAFVKAGLAFPKTHDIAALVGLLPAQHRLSNRDVEERNRDCPLDVLTFSLNLPAPSP